MLSKVCRNLDQGWDFVFTRARGSGFDIDTMNKLLICFTCMYGLWQNISVEQEIYAHIL